MYSSPMSIGSTDSSGAPIYPYGLCISLTEKELEKLNLESDAQVGDLIHLHAMAKVTSVSQNDTSKGLTCRVELQITALAAEDESEENEENEEAEEQEEMPQYRVDRSKFYK